LNQKFKTALASITMASARPVFPHHRFPLACHLAGARGQAPGWGRHRCAVTAAVHLD